jgi:HlyD family secretion protein
MNNQLPGQPDSSLADRAASSRLLLVADDVWPTIMAGVLALVVLIGGLGTWAATAELAGAVMADGTVVVDSYVKKVQHPQGGIVNEIRVRDGDRVRAGDLLVRLDDTITRANLQIIANQIDEIAARKARLAAERDGVSELSPPVSLVTRGDQPRVAEIMAGEQALFASRRSAMAGRKAQLGERIRQLREQIVGLESQREAKSQELALVGRELTGLYDLQTKKLVPSMKVTSLEREAARIGGERGQLVAALAEVRGRISELELQIIQIDQDLTSEVSRELRDLQTKEAELGERMGAAEDQLKRVDILSPQAGIVHQLSVHTIGGVVGPSEALMLIVPAGDALVIDAKVAPQSIDHVREGQTAMVRFTAFDLRATPEIAGVVQRVAADLTREAPTGQSYFIARIVLPEAVVARAGMLRLVPGMPAEVHIRTGDRTALSYLLKPLSDQIARAFTEP